MGYENITNLKEPTIRRANLNDIKSIARVHVNCWCETYKNILPQSYLESLKYNDRAQMWAKHLPRKDKKAATLVLTGIDEDVVGFCDFGPAREHEHGIAGEIYSIYILEKYQSLGWGKKFINNASNFFKECGIGSFYLWVLEDNKNVGFYLHLGGKILKSQDIEIGGKVLKENLIYFEVS